MSRAGPVRQGDTLGDFAIVREIGRGGMGVVYRAQDPSGRAVAVKLLQARREALARFSREARLQDQLGETEGFVPIPEGQSKFNTKNTPFDLYDAGTPKGAELGNTHKGDGPLFRGRGYVQLTGRDNYTRIGVQLGVDLVSKPDRANDPAIAGMILARFLHNKEDQVRVALASSNLKLARKLVNGGSHGLDRFVDAYERGLTAIS